MVDPSYSGKYQEYDHSHLFGQKDVSEFDYEDWFLISCYRKDI